MDYRVGLKDVFEVVSYITQYILKAKNRIAIIKTI